MSNQAGSYQKFQTPAEACLELLCCVSTQEYLGITGNPKFNALSAQLAFGEGSPVIMEGRNATVQCLSGTGSLRVSLSSDLSPRQQRSATP